MNIGYIRILVNEPAAEKVRQIETDQNAAFEVWAAFADKYGARKTRMRLTQGIDGWVRLAGLIFGPGVQIPAGFEPRQMTQAEQTASGTQVSETVYAPSHTNKNPGKAILAEMEALPAAPCNLTIGEYLFGLGKSESLVKRLNGEVTQRFNLEKVGRHLIVTAYVGGNVAAPEMPDGCTVIRESEYWLMREAADIEPIDE